MPPTSPPENLNEENDIDLLRRTAEGDRVAFSALYDRFARPLYSLALKFVGNATDAEDLVQEVFVELWNKADQFDATRAQPFTWMVAITRNRAIDRVRSRTRRAAIVERSAEDIASFSLATRDTDIHAALWSDESAAIVREAFTHLPDEQRAPIALAFFEGLTQTEIASRLNEPLGTIKARIRRGLVRLRDHLAGRI